MLTDLPQFVYDGALRRNLWYDLIWAEYSPITFGMYDVLTQALETN